MIATLAAPQKLRYPRGGFAPSVNLAGLILAWWNADDLSDGAVTTWTDRVGSIAPTQASSGLRPVKAAGSHNGRAGVTFDGTDDVLAVTSFAAAPTGANSCEIWAAVNAVPPVNTNTHMFQYGGTAAGTHRTMRYSRNASGVPTRYILYDGTNIGTDVGTDGLGYHVLQEAFDGSALAITGRIDGRPTRPSSVAMASLATGATRLAIGASNAATTANWWGGSIRHLLITSLLTVLQRLQLEGWLAWDAGVPEQLAADHPFRNGMP